MAKHVAVLKKLAGGDFRSIGNSDTIVDETLANPTLFPDVYSGLLHDDPLIRMRAADAVEKITRQKPKLLQRFKKVLLESVAYIEQQEVQWHVAQLIPRLKLSRRDMPKVRSVFDAYLKTTPSNIVRVMSLQALADLALQGKIERNHIARKIEEYADRVGTPSVRARSKKLLKQLSSGRRRT